MSKIPFCRSEFLQDFSIELGRKLNRFQLAAKSVVAEVDSCEHEGQDLERLSVWIRTWCMTRVTMTLWEDQTVWISVELLPTENDKDYRVSFYPDCEKFTATGMVEALRDTVGVSTRLCYAESPLPVLRKIWAYEGEVETDGFLRG